jgi:pyridoxal 5'-phosphate synthase pdxS subunit
VVEAVRHCRAVMGAIKQLQTLDEDEIYVYAKVRPVFTSTWDMR